jgi:predicted MFS family arabinose efflux permease
MIEIALETPIMRRRAIYHACMFGSFSVFWTAVPLWLADPPFGLSQHGIAYIALAGVAGAIAPPIAGRLADGGHSRFGTIVAMILATGAFLLTMLIHSGSRFSLILIALAAIVLDFAVSSNLVFGQRAIFSLGPEQRSRLNGMFMATFFAGGAICAGVSGWAYARFGWIGVSAFGAALPLLSLVYLASEAIGPTSRTVAMSPK